MRCARCPRELREGDTAYVQLDQVIRVEGETITFQDEEVVVCETCAEGDESAADA